MIATEKVLTAVLKDISNVLNVLGAGLASGPLREYSITKSNYFYGKVEKDVEEWLAEIDRILEANNMADRRKVAVVAVYLRDIMAD